MPIVYNEEAKQFHLYNNDISYIMNILPTGTLAHVYYGKKMPTGRDYTYLKSTMNHVQKVFTDDDTSYISYDDTMQELPVFGRGDYRSESIRLTYTDGSSLNHFLYIGHEVFQGAFADKHSGLPHSHTNKDDQATTLRIDLEDSFRQVKIQLYYTVFENVPVISRNTVIVNNSSEDYFIDKCASANIDFYEMNYELMQFDGGWSRERHVAKQALSVGKSSFGSTRGCSSASHNPFYILLESGADEDHGNVYGISLIYSGNFEASVEVNQFHQTRAQIGIHPDGFRWCLRAGSEFSTPEAIMTFSNEGLNGLSHANHQFVKEHIIPVDQRTEPQVLINNWEATYFNFDEDKIVDIAKEAKTLGVNLFVLDDGWFVGRDHDQAALGDWFVDKKKLPAGIRHLSDTIHGLDMDFGLWIEPEMINKDSDLYRTHPEWLISHNAYDTYVGRHQYVLDFSNPEVVDYIHQLMSDIIGEANVDYIKWDMNRLISEPFSRALKPEQQGEFFHRYIIGVYELYRRLTSEFSHVTFESCASGGSRFDLGMLCYAIQTWTSDNTDPYERLMIQTGTSYLYPLKTMGSHVSAKVNHQTLRDTSLEYKSHVALFGTYGLELDVRHMSASEKTLMTSEIELFKNHQQLIHQGRFYRLETPFDISLRNHNELTSWMVVDESKDKVIAGVYTGLAKPNPNQQRLYLKGLDENKIYMDESTKLTYTGSELMGMGMVLDQFFTGIFTDVDDHVGLGEMRFGHGDFTSKIIILTCVK